MFIADEGGTNVFSFKLGGPLLLWLIVPSSVALILKGLSSALEVRRTPEAMVFGETSDSLSLAVAIELAVVGAADRGACWGTELG